MQLRDDVSVVVFVFGVVREATRVEFVPQSLKKSMMKSKGAVEFYVRHAATTLTRGFRGTSAARVREVEDNLVVANFQPV